MSASHPLPGGMRMFKLPKKTDPNQITSTSGGILQGQCCVSSAEVGQSQRSKKSVMLFYYTFIIAQCFSIIQQWHPLKVSKNEIRPL